MIYTKGHALCSLKPNAQYSWVGTDYSGLQWLDSGTAPTESEIDASEQNRSSKENSYQES